jgi:hypothetical protein
MGQPARKLTAKDANQKLAHRRLTVLELADENGSYPGAVVPMESWHEKSVIMR